MKKIYSPLKLRWSLTTKLCIALFVLAFINESITAQTKTFTPSDDAYVRNGIFGNTNFGSDTSLIVKSTVSSGFTRLSYLKFSLGSITKVRSAKLRLYGSDKDTLPLTRGVKISLFGIDDNSWTEGQITFNNAPPSSSSLASVSVNNVAKYYEFDVTDFVNARLTGNKLVSFSVKDTLIKDKNIVFNSKENSQNIPQLVVDTTPPSPQLITLVPTDDAYVRNGILGNTNYGNDTSLIVKSSVSNGFTRLSYLKFSLGSITAVRSAKLRLYGSNTDTAIIIKGAFSSTGNKDSSITIKKDTSTSVKITLFGVNDDTWTETGITFNNAPPSSTSLTSVAVNNVAKYYEFDVTNFVNAQLTGNKLVSFSVKDTAIKNKNIVFNSKENSQNIPQLVIDTTPFSPPPPPPPKPITLEAIADAYVRNGTFSNSNFGTDTSLIVKGTTGFGVTRNSYLKFSLGELSYIRSAKVRLFLSNKENSSSLNVPLFGINDDSWTETGITFNNAPTTSSPSLTSTAINNAPGYYEFDVTDFARAQLTGNKVASFLIKDTLNKNTMLTFNSKENNQNHPQLVIDTARSNALLFVQNMDGFPSNDHVVFSRIQIPWTRDSVYNANHDSVEIRLHNYGISPLIISNFKISVDTLFKIDKVNGKTYNPLTQLPALINSGDSLSLTVKFIANNVGNQTSRAKILHQTLTITSNDDKAPDKKVYLDGLWQFSGEGKHEPYSAEIFATFGFKTRTGFGGVDPDLGDSTKLKGDEIKPDFMVRADTTLPITVTQMAAYHGCCHQEEIFKWFNKGGKLNFTVFSHVAVDAQALLPRGTTTGAPASGTFTPSGPFGVVIKAGNTTAPYLNTLKQMGVRIYKVFDVSGNIIPNNYILANDYLGAESNHDYNDNVYYLTNLKPYLGTVYYSPLNVTPSDLDFGEHVLQTKDSLLLNISSGGKTYPDGSRDPSLVISSVVITGENASEFSADMPLNTTLNPQQATTIKVKFNPTSQGLKIADMLIYYNNSQSPKRVPLYGIAKAPGVIVTVNYRINSGASAPSTFNGKTWAADNQYAFDNLAPFTNTALKQIEATDEDFLYLDGQSSNGDKKPFRYQFPVANGTYYIRLHFAEIYWGAQGQGLAGGAGSRVFSIKLENQYRLTNYDVAADAGVATAVIKNFPVTVTDGNLNIDFSASLNKPLVSAVEVYSFSSPSPKPAVVAATQNRSGSISISSTGESFYNFNKPRVYPNPLRNKNFNIQFPAKYRGNYNLQLVDMSGRKYDLGKIKLNGAGCNLKVDISGFSLKPGMYILKIGSGANKADVLKLLINQTP